MFAVIHVPQVRQASMFLQRVQDHPTGRWVVSCNLTACSACKR